MPARWSFLFLRRSASIDLQSYASRLLLRCAGTAIVALSRASAAHDPPPRCSVRPLPVPRSEPTRPSTTRPDRGAARQYSVLPTAAAPALPPPLADQAVLVLRRWRRCSRTRATSRGPVAQVPRPATPSRPVVEPQEELRGEVVGERVDDDGGDERGADPQRAQDSADALAAFRRSGKPEAEPIGLRVPQGAGSAGRQQGSATRGTRSRWDRLLTRSSPTRWSRGSDHLASRRLAEQPECE
jgi:hypothetical protein